MSICFNNQNITDSDEETTIIKDPSLKQIPFCKNCKDTEMVVEQTSATAICRNCGLSINYQDDRLNPEFREGVQIISPYAYKRINHFKEWLAQLQAKENTDIPDIVFNNILLEYTAKCLRQTSNYCNYYPAQVRLTFKFNVGNNVNITSKKIL